MLKFQEIYSECSISEEEKKYLLANEPVKEGNGIR